VSTRSALACNHPDPASRLDLFKTSMNSETKMNLTSMSVRHKASNQNPSGLSREAPATNFVGVLQRWTGTPPQTAAIAFSSPYAPSTVRNSGAPQVAQRSR
jgi:hypothetical protein